MRYKRNSSDAKRNYPFIYHISKCSPNKVWSLYCSGILWQKRGNFMWYSAHKNITQMDREIPNRVSLNVRCNQTGSDAVNCILPSTSEYSWLPNSQVNSILSLICGGCFWWKSETKWNLKIGREGKCASGNVWFWSIVRFDYVAELELFYLGFFFSPIVVCFMNKVEKM